MKWLTLLLLISTSATQVNAMTIQQTADCTAPIVAHSEQQWLGKVLGNYQNHDIMLFTRGDKPVAASGVITNSSINADWVAGYHAAHHLSVSIDTFQLTHSGQCQTWVAYFK